MNQLKLLIKCLLIIAVLMYPGQVGAIDELGAKASINIQATGAAQVQASADDGATVSINTQGVGVSNFHFSSVPETDFFVSITGEGRVDMIASGHSNLNITVEGPSEIRITAGEEVTINVEADEEAQVFINEVASVLSVEDWDQVLVDLSEPVEDAAIKENEVQLLSGDVDLQASTTNLKIIAGIIPVLTIAVFLNSIIKKEGMN